MTENLFLQDQAVSFHRPYPASLTALHEKQPEQGIFYRQDGTPFLKLWMKNACDVKIVIGQDTYILLEVERNLWEVTLPLEPGFYYAALYVDSVEIASPYLPIGYGHSRPCNYLEIGPVMEACRLKDVLHGSIRHEYFYSEVTGQTESCLVYAPPGYDRDQLRLPVLYLQHGFGENEGSWVWQGRIGWMMDNFLSEKKVMPMLIVMADGMMSEDGDPEKKNQSVIVYEISDAGSDAVCRGALPRTDGTGKLRGRRAFDGIDAGGHGSVFLPGKICLDRAFFRLSAQLYRRGGNCGQPFDAGVCGRRGIQSEYETFIPRDGA